MRGRRQFFPYAEFERGLCSILLDVDFRADDLNFDPPILFVSEHTRLVTSCPSRHSLSSASRKSAVLPGFSVFRPDVHRAYKAGSALPCNRDPVPEPGDRGPVLFENPAFPRGIW